MKNKKLLLRFLENPKNIKFKDFRKLVESFGFNLSRVNGSHHIFCHPQIKELVNIQEVRGEAKPYQIRQFLKIIERYNLQMSKEK
jgi:predicted RNA binding protein YcfA (HicA-like mRNA interferase family)